MDKVLAWLVDHGGFGTIFGIIVAFVALRLWYRNNELQDSRDRMAKEIERTDITVRNLERRLESAIDKAAADRRDIMSAVERMRNGHR